MINKRLFQDGFKQTTTHFIRELPQTLLGYLISLGYNLSGRVKSITFYGGATAIETFSSDWGAFTLGNFIIGQRGLTADPDNWLFRHEYGHYLQSRAMGWGYLSRIAIPSLMSAFMKDGNHSYQIFEQDADRRAFIYFNKHPEQQNLIKNLSLNAKWYDYLSGILFGLPMGVVNGIYYKNHRVK